MVDVKQAHCPAILLLRFSDSEIDALAIQTITLWLSHMSHIYIYIDIKIYIYISFVLVVFQHYIQRSYRKRVFASRIELCPTKISGMAWNGDWILTWETGHSLAWWVTSRFPNPLGELVPLNNLKMFSLQSCECLIQHRRIERWHNFWIQTNVNRSADERNLAPPGMPTLQIVQNFFYHSCGFPKAPEDTMASASLFSLFFILWFWKMCAFDSFSTSNAKHCQTLSLAQSRKSLGFCWFKTFPFKGRIQSFSEVNVYFKSRPSSSERNWHGMLWRNRTNQLR